ncbi:3-keto-disaccharide hydrolase [Flindersiella endophytica]
MSEWISLFDGESLDGWFAAPRTYGTVWPGGPRVLDAYGVRDDYNERAAEHPAVWSVEDGTIVGRQDPDAPGWGGYLVSERAYGDFELVLEARPDWPADTGVMIHRRRDGWEGFQVLLDHRPSGGIGGFFGNGLASFSAVPFAVDAIIGEDGRPAGLRADDPATSVEPVTQEKIDRLDYAAGVEEFLAAWRWADWNELRIHCAGGALPRITTWVNDVKIAELDTSRIDSPDYDPDAVAAALGPEGHIALEVHDNDQRFGESRWGRGAACRWRGIRIRELRG